MSTIAKCGLGSGKIVIVIITVKIVIIHLRKQTAGVRLTRQGPVTANVEPLPLLGGVPVASWSRWVADASRSHSPRVETGQYEDQIKKKFAIKKRVERCDHK